jgi:hypothetical protein
MLQPNFKALPLKKKIWTVAKKYFCSKTKKKCKNIVLVGDQWSMLIGKNIQ